MFRFFLDAYLAELEAQATGKGGDQGGPPRQPPAPQPGPQAGGLDMGPLVPHLRPGRDGTWILAAVRGAWGRQEDTEPGSLWSVRMAGAQVRAGRRRFGVALAIGADRGTRGAGLALADKQSARSL